MTILIDSSAEKFVFSNQDGTIAVVCDIGSILDAGGPIDPETGEDLDYLGIADESAGRKIDCRTYMNKPEILFR
jgi:hypothetical protein